MFFNRTAPKVLVLCPAYNASKTIDRWITEAKTWKGVTQFVFAENNSSDDTLAKIVNSGLNFKLIRLWFNKQAHSQEGSYGPVAIMRQLMLQYARTTDADYIMWLDSDVYPLNSDFITRLIKNHSPIAGGIYLRFFDTGPGITAVFKEDPQRRVMLREKKKLVAAVGGGFTLVSRKVFMDKRLNYYPIRVDHSEDFGYYHNASDMGYPVLLDTTVTAEHETLFSINKAWDTSLPNFCYSD